LTTAYLGLGSNLGDRRAYLKAARRELEAAGIRIVRESDVLDTEPVGITEQPRFLNQVVEVDWQGSAEELLAAAKEVERKVGRTATYRWGPREIDIDILKFGDQEVNDVDLRIPHPEIGNRPFLGRLLNQLGAA
jgi:2-amino-4-hydroxy-6-hydroxymethyldihydropteridine diphosphokinase